MPAWRKISLWMDQLQEPLEARASLEHDLDVDVAIIGAGYTGLWTAYYLKRHAPQLKVVIIEAQTAGFGASGRNGGWLMGNLWAKTACSPVYLPSNAGPRLTCCMASPMKSGRCCSAKASTATTARAGRCTVPPATPSKKPACANTWPSSTAKA